MPLLQQAQALVVPGPSSQPVCCARQQNTQRTKARQITCTGTSKARLRHAPKQQREANQEHPVPCHKRFESGEDVRDVPVDRTIIDGDSGGLVIVTSLTPTFTTMRRNMIITVIVAFIFTALVVIAVVVERHAKLALRCRFRASICTHDRAV
jgi:hypothetical protein